jgi:putative cell wall-binding protein
MQLLRLFMPALLVCVLVLALAPLAGAEEHTDGDAADDDYEQVVDITFPTDPRATYIDDYAFARSGGRVHRATDLMGEKMWEVYAAVGGEITWIPGADGGPKPSYGYMIRIAGDDGRDYSYVHLNDDTPGTSDSAGGPEHAYAPGLEQGSRVERGELIGWMGDSGNAKGGTPHLHFEISDPHVTDPYGSTRINPYNALRAAEKRGDYAPRAGQDTSDDDGDDRPAGTPPGADRPANVDRISGTDRVGTAVAVSEESFEEADTVVIASGFSFPDSIAAGPLAAVLDAPVLTSFPEWLDDRIVDEIDRLGATNVVVVGRAANLDESVVDELVERTALDEEDVRRIFGADEPSTAARVAAEVRAHTGQRDVLVALGSHPDEGSAWPDALTAGSHGALTGQPVLLVDRDGLPDVTRTALEEADTVTIVGGSAAISPAIAEEIGDVVDDVRRLSGADRFATAAAVADDLLDRGDAAVDRLWAATGSNYADALAAAAALSHTGELLILVDGRGGKGDASVDDWFTDRAEEVSSALVVGGTQAVSSAAAERLAERIR